jgi:type IV pilus assembly protein PilE
MKKRLTHGFTLIELMITVAIIGVLAAVAYPSYTSHVVKARRSAMESFMLNVANKQEQYVLNSRAYADTLAKLGLTVPTDVSSYYNVTLAADNAAAPPTYLVTAAPKGAQLSNDTKCGTLTLNNAGTKTEGGTATSVTECW